MDLLLSVVSDPEGANMLKHTKLFNREGGSVGRADSNDWVLPDPQRVVSSRHAEISFVENRYFLTDQSTNGTFHNQSSDPVGKGNRIPLADGDLVSLGDYQLKVSVRKPAMDSGIPEGLGSADFLDNSDRTTFSPAAEAKMQSARDASELDSWLEPAGDTKGSQSGEWGYLVSPGGGSEGASSLDSLLGVEAPTDPLQVLDPADSFGSIGGAGTVHPPSGQWAGDDAWWKDGSEQDHTPADSHAMQLSAIREPAPSPSPLPQVQSVPGVNPPEPPGVINTPVMPTDQQPDYPAPVAPAHEQNASSTTDNPFAESFSAMAGSQVEGTPGFATPNSPAQQAPLRASTSDAFASASQQFTPPAMNAGIQPAPQPAEREQQPAAQVPSQVRPQQKSTAGSPGVAAALAQELGLNLDSHQLAELDTQAAAIVEESVARLIDLLRARTSIKNELRVQRTMIQTEANNPLKFSATARDALGAMFAGTSAFMSPVEAVRDSFDDLSDHQVAVLSGMRAGYEAMLRFFSPENIAKRGGAHNGVFASKNARNWESFVDSYRKMVSDPDACYRQLFGEEFATTYEHQLSELKNARKMNHFNRR